MAPNIKITYFNFRGRGEVLRLILHVAGVEFIDERIERADWPALKPKSPTGTLPYMEIDGKQYGESLPLARFLARRYNLMGKTEFDQLNADIILNLVEDVRIAYVRFKMDRLLTDEQKKELEAKFNNETVPGFLTKIEKILGENPDALMVGDSLTVADLAVMEIVETPLKGNPKLLDKFPKIALHRQKIQKLPKIDKYLATRPDTLL